MERLTFKSELVQHFIDRKLSKEIFQNKNIQTFQGSPQILSDIADDYKTKKIPKKWFNIIQKELSNDYSEIRYLAKGSQGYAVLVKEKQTNKRFVIKAYLVRDTEGNFEEEEHDGKEKMQDAQNEINILSKAKGSNYVVNFIKHIDVKENRFLYLVLTEYQGTLLDIIESTQDKKLNELSAIKYSKDIAEGLMHIHSKGYLVNDLKEENILIDYNSSAVISDFGLGQKMKNNSDYAYKLHKGNLYFQAPECVSESQIYQDEYKKQEVQTQMNPSSRSDACSFGYLIYTLVQGKKDILSFMQQKMKPLEYDENFMQFKYCNQLQQIIDGLTKFKPRERISINQAFEILNEIMSIEFNLEIKLQIDVSEQTQILSKNQFEGIEFVEKYDKRYYPIVKDEDSFLQEFVSQNLSSKELLGAQKNLQNENKYLQEGQENLKKILKEKEYQIQEIQASSQKIILQKEKEIQDLKETVQTKSQEIQNLQEDQDNLKKTLKDEQCQKQELLASSQKIIKEKEQEIQDLQAKVSTKNEEIKNLKIEFKEQKDSNLFLQKNQEFLQKNIQEKVQDIVNLEKQVKAKMDEVEDLKLKIKNLQDFNSSLQEKNNIFQAQVQEKDQVTQKQEKELTEKIINLQKEKNDLESENKNFQENLEQAQKKIEDLEKLIQFLQRV